METVLHLGAHKTASTHLQRSLRAAAPALQDGGVALFTPPDLRGAGGLPLEAAAAGDAAAAARLHAAWAATGRRLVISEENLLGPALRAEAPDVLYPRAHHRLAAMLGLVPEAGDDAAPPGPVQLMLAVRDPADWLVSSHGQRMMAGHWTRFDAFLAGHDPRRLTWSELVVRLLGVPGVTGCDIWRFEDWPAVMPVVLARMLPAALVPAIPPAPRAVNPGLSARALAALAEEAAPDRAARRAAAAAVQALYPKGPEHPAPQPFAPGLRAEIAAAHAEDLAALACLPGAHVLQPAS